MFERTDVDPNLGRLYDGSRPVWVRVANIWRSGPGPIKHNGGLTVRSRGLNLVQTVPGLLHGWVREQHGAWLAMVSYTIAGPHGVEPLRQQHLVPSDAVTPRRPGETEMPF